MARLYFDLETIPDQGDGAHANAASLVKVPASYKKPEAIEKYRQEHAADAYLKTSLSGLHGEICSIAWAIDDGKIDGQIRLPGESEKDLIEAFFEAVYFDVHREGQGAHPSLEWIGHNVIDFDLRFLKQRCIVNQTKPYFRIPSEARHGKGGVFDTMREWCGWKGFVKQDALCEALGIEGKTGGISGADVWPMYQAGKFGEILAYNKDDVRIVREMHRRLSFN